MGLSHLLEHDRFTALVAMASFELCMTLYKKYKTKRMQKEVCGRCNESNLEENFCKVLFFPDKQVPCFNYLLTAQGCTRISCLHSHDEESSFIQLIRYVLNARKSIDLCMFSLSCKELAEAVLIKYRMGAEVRVIADTEYMNMNGSKIPNFMSEGIAVRHDRSSYLMHHKYVVIDGEVVITGSFNWTHAAVIGNYENIVATNNRDIVEPYVTEFNRLWELFDAESGPRRDVSADSVLLGKSEKYYIKDNKRQHAV